MDTQRIKRFAEQLPRRAPFVRLVHGQRTPSKAAIRKTITDFEEKGLVISQSGLTAEIAAEWCREKGQSFQLLYQATLKVWVLMPITDQQIENIVTT